MRYGAAIIGVFVVIVLWGGRPLAGQGLGLIRGQVRAEANQTGAQLRVQARHVQSNTIMATSAVDEKTAEYELTLLPDGTYLVELVDRDGDALCSEGPFEVTTDRLLYEAQSIACDESRWWRPLLATAAGGATAGVLFGRAAGGGSAPPPTTVCHEGGTKTVYREALAGHLSHGDSLGACPTSPSR